MGTWFSNIYVKFISIFIKEQGYIYIIDGLKITFEVTLLSLLFGMLIGAVIAIVRTTHDQTREEARKGPGHLFLGAADAICRVYLTIIRGTPTMVQLLLWFLVFLKNADSKILVAVVGFSINSGAYVAEIFRSGIMSVDLGQMEAGRSLGLGYKDTMLEIIMPQAIKNCLPALVNEMITLLKETSISGAIGLNELTRGGNIIIGKTYEAFLPLIVVAVIYLVIVMFFTWCMGILERRLRRSDLR